MSFHNKINSTQQFPMKSCFSPHWPIRSLSSLSHGSTVVVSAPGYGGLLGIVPPALRITFGTQHLGKLAMALRRP